MKIEDLRTPADPEARGDGKDEDKGDDLTEQQRRAVELLVMGKSVSATARAVGVTRETVSRWANGKTAFMAAMNRMRRDLHASHRDRLRHLASRAYDVLEESLCEDSPPHIRLKAALAVIEAAKQIEGEVGFTSTMVYEVEWLLNRAGIAVDALQLEALMKRQAGESLKAIKQLDEEREKLRDRGG